MKYDLNSGTWYIYENNIWKRINSNEALQNVWNILEHLNSNNSLVSISKTPLLNGINLLKTCKIIYYERPERSARKS